MIPKQSENRNKIILDLCGGSGAWSKPYKDAGYDVRLITLPDNDVRTYKPPKGVYGILAAPPCTEFSLIRVGKRVAHIKRDFDGGMDIVNACMAIMSACESKVFWAIENPVGHLIKFLGEPRLKFQPWEYGDPWTKRTAIWGNFNIPPKQYKWWAQVPKNENLYKRPGRNKPNMIWLHKAAKQYIPDYAPFEAKTDADFRALTPQGFARAFFEVNK